MWINNINDIKRFEETIDKCKESVMVVTRTGEEYDLKDMRGYYLGLASMLDSNENNEPEVYAESREDEGMLLNYLKDTAAQRIAC